LKKRTKKLLSVKGGARQTWVASTLGETEKSFLLLFFKKEVLPFLPREPVGADRQDLAARPSTGIHANF
jgi:hypothetical protein